MNLRCHNRKRDFPELHFVDTGRWDTSLDCVESTEDLKKRETTWAIGNLPPEDDPLEQFVSKDIVQTH